MYVRICVLYNVHLCSSSVLQNVRRYAIRKHTCIFIMLNCSNHAILELVLPRRDDLEDQ